MAKMASNRAAASAAANFTNADHQDGSEFRRFQVGDMVADFATCKIYVLGPDGNPVLKLADCVAELESIESTFDITQPERASGKRDPRSAPLEVRVTFKITWIGSFGRRTAWVTGNQLLLTNPPANWGKATCPADIPSELLSQPFWPPMTGGRGLDFTQLAKEAGAEKLALIESTRKMGWFPASDGSACFVLVNQTVGANGYTSAVAPNITDISASISKNIDVELVPQDHANRDDVIVDDISKVLDAFLGLLNVPGYGELLLAASLRPVIPLRPETTLMMVGGPAAGKSLAASLPMSGWQAKPGTWNEKRLPGQASDTKAYAEIARSVTPIWVSDDVAPTTSERTSQQRLDDTQDLVRSQHNGSAKGRSSSSGKAQVMRDPQCQFMLTAENALQIASVNQRLITMSFHPGCYNDEKLKLALRIRDHENNLSRIVGYCIEYQAGQMDDSGWEACVDAWEFNRRQTADALKLKFMENGIKSHGVAERMAGQAADLSVALELLRRVAAGSDFDIAEDIELAKDHIANAVFENYSNHEEQTLGAAYVAAAGSMIATRHAYLKVLDDVINEQKTRVAMDTIFEECGYERDAFDGWMEPRGLKPIGYAKYDKKLGVVYAALESDMFPTVKRFSTQIPSGTTAAAAFRSIKTDGLGVPGIGYLPSKNKNHLKRISANGVARSIAPVDLKILLSGGKVSSDDMAELDP